MKKKVTFLKIWETLLAVVFMAIVFVVWIQVFSRMFLPKIPAWTGEEMTTFLLLWMIMIGAAVSMGRKTHIAVDAIVNLLPEKFRSFIDKIAYILMALFLGYLSCTGFLYVWSNRATATPRMKIPTLLLQGSIPIGTTIMLAYVICFLIESFRQDKRRGRDNG